MKILMAVLAVGVQYPIWIYLLYKIMMQVEATELMWFLFWIYVPVGIVAQALVSYYRKQ